MISTDTRVAMVNFHGRLDDEVLYRPIKHVESVPGTVPADKDFLVRERDLSYRFALHQHPYVGRLMQKLIRTGVPGLQATDTEYARGGLTLPGSVEVRLDAAGELPLVAGARLVLSADTTVTDPGGAPVDLGAGATLRLTGPASLAVQAGVGVTLLEGISGLPDVGTVFALAQTSASVLTDDTPGRLAAAAPVLLHSGEPATLPAGTDVVVREDAPTTVATGTHVRLLRRQWLPKELFEELFTAGSYAPTELVHRPYPVKDLDFSAHGAYAPYNWELFFHLPLTIAMHLSKNQRFAEAQRWFHFLFDPTDDSEGPTPERFWKVRPFQYTDVKKIEELLVNLATGADPALAADTKESLTAAKEAPFRPHAIARHRHQAYMYKTVMAYLDNLIAWGDSLFRQDTGDAVDEALMLYVLAAEILGPKPLPVPAKGTMRAQTYDNLRKDLKQFGTVMRDVESYGAFDLAPFPGESGGNGAGLATVRSLGKALYFRVPRNDQLLGYWDTVADRLFKIRNSLNLAGTFRRMALYEPPIDPALLARAAASGLDVASIVNGLNQPLSLVRFPVLAQMAVEIAQEVKSLGNGLLSALEKEDAEALTLLRAQHERVLLELAEQVKYGQVQEAGKSKEALMQSLASAVQRYTYFERQLGKKDDEILRAVPGLGDLDLEDLAKMELVALEPSMAPRVTEVDIAGDLGASGGHVMNRHESEELSKLATARDKHDSAADLEKVAGALAVIPNFGGHFQPFGPGASISFGGSNLSAAMNFVAAFHKASAEKNTYEAGTSAKVGSYARREQEWAYQSNAAVGDINSIFKQLRAAQIREAVAAVELANHRRQLAHSRAIEQFLNVDGTDRTGKVINKAFLTWLKRDCRGLYQSCFQVAFDVARHAERALQHELGDASLTFLKYGYLSGKEGLLAGEKLYLDIRRMELAYHELRQREYELTKHVSLLQVDPMALIQLRATGRCTVHLPETLFDLDGPGHYFRRIRSMAVSVPCVTGPYGGVNLTVTQLKSSIRKTPVAGDDYARTGPEDPRFDDYFGSAQSVVTSSGQNDSGLFDAGTPDERYFPFQYSGLLSDWLLEFPADPSKGEPAQFDYATATDVLLHFKYTARPGGNLLRGKALQEISRRIEDATLAGSVRLFSVRHEFPTEWAAFLRKPPVGRHSLELTLRPEHYPYWAQNRLKEVSRVDVLARSAKATVPASVPVFDAGEGAAKQDPLVKDPSRGNLLIGHLSAIALPPSPTGKLQLFLDDAELDDLWLAVSWGG